MNILELSFDEYGELIGVNVKGCGSDYYKEKEKWLEEYNNIDDNERYDEVVELEDGWVLNYGWGNFDVCLEVDDKFDVVDVMISEESEVEGYLMGNVKREGGYKYFEGVYVFEDEEEEMLSGRSVESCRRENDIMVVMKDVENYNMR